MGYLNFDKSLLSNLEESLSKEMLRTNKSGAYHCTTIIGCNTRKYHGLLTIPVAELGGGNHVLLSSFDETVVQHGAEFNLGIHKYGGEYYSPKGHKYIREFNCDVVPYSIYRVGGVILSKEKVFISHENRILIKYTLLDAHSPTTLRFRPFLAFRSVNDLCVENSFANTSYGSVTNGVSMCLYQGYPDLFMQFNKPAEFISSPAWNKGIEYPKDQERGYPYKEDLYVPGYFEVPIKKGESLIFSAGISEVEVDKLDGIYKQEIANRTSRSNSFNCLKNSAQQFLNRKSADELYLLAGYPWFKCRARDMFISLPGVSLAFGDLSCFEEVMATMIPDIYHFMRGESLERDVLETDDPDVLLWAVWALQEYAKEVGLDKMWERYGSLLKDVIDFIVGQRHPSLFLHDNGLLYVNAGDRAMTWMNTTFNGRPITPRTGYVVEINALWYNALCFASELTGRNGENFLADRLRTMSEKAKESFNAIFWNGIYLYDFVDGTERNQEVRPNMIFAVSLPYSPLESKQRKSVVDITTKELLTAKGLRSLSPKSCNYRGSCEGSQVDRDFSAFQGAVWPWLMGAYIEAYLRVYRASGVSFVQRSLIGFEEEMFQNCIGSISEMYDGNPPFKGRGGISFAMNVAEILRIQRVLDHYAADARN